jgi:hypothetical protein
LVEHKNDQILLGVFFRFELVQMQLPILLSKTYSKQEKKR